MNASKKIDLSRYLLAYEFSASSAVSSTVAALAFPFSLLRSSDISSFGASVKLEEEASVSVGGWSTTALEGGAGLPLVLMPLFVRVGPENSWEDPQFGNVVGSCISLDVGETLVVVVVRIVLSGTVELDWSVVIDGGV